MSPVLIFMIAAAVPCTGNFRTTPPLLTAACVC